MNSDHPAPARVSAGALLRLGVLLLAVWIQTAGAQEDGPPQDIVLMLDNSGSMRKNDPEFLTRVAVKTFLERIQGDVQIAIIMFDQNVHELMPLTQLNDATRQDFLNALSALDYRGLLTNSPAALEKSTYELRTKGRPGSQKSIIFMTDGIVDVGKDGFDEGDVEKARWMKTTLVDEAAKYHIRIYGIAYTDNADFELIQTLSSKTGGEYYRAANADEIESVFHNIVDALAQQGQATSRAFPAPVEQPAAAEAGETQPTQEPAGQTGAETPAIPETPLPESALPESTLPEASLPESALPESALPESTLPESSLPESTLPEAAIPETTLPEAAPGQATPAETTSPGTQESTTGGESPSAVEAESQPQPATPEPAPTSASQPTPPPPAQNLPVAMLAGASAVLLALIAIVLFLIKRKPAKAGGTDPLMPKAFLNDIGNVTGQNSYELGEKPTIIGRLQGSDPQAANYIVIDEATIGRRHSLIEYKDHSFWVADQNSLNGTFVNNKRIETSTRLKHGDRLRFHKHEFEFLILDMFETDRTMMSQTVFAERTSDLDAAEDDDATEIREPSGDDETIRRPDS